jgi:hypothetical protein
MVEDKSIYIATNKFSDELCDRAIGIFEKIKKSEPSRIKHHTVNPDIVNSRKDKQLFLNDLIDVGAKKHANDEVDALSIDAEIADSEITVRVNDALNVALGEYLQLFEPLLYCNLRSTRQKLQKTGLGEGYHLWHFEQADYLSSDRVLAWTIYLNDVEEGGETEFLYQSKRIKPEKGKICIFPAQFNYTHRGNPPISNDKYIITGWYILS